MCLIFLLDKYKSKEIIIQMIKISCSFKLLLRFSIFSYVTEQRRQLTTSLFKHLMVPAWQICVCTILKKMVSNGIYDMKQIKRDSKNQKFNIYYFLKLFMSLSTLLLPYTQIFDWKSGPSNPHIFKFV